MAKLKWNSLLDKAKDLKKVELSNTTKEKITGYFYCEVNGQGYYFSCDSEAQSNLLKFMIAFDKGWYKKVQWSAYVDVNEESTVLELNKKEFEDVFKAHLEHIQSNLTKFRTEIKVKMNKEKSAKKLIDMKWE